MSGKQLKNNLWIGGLVAGGLFFLNIFILISHKPRLEVNSSSLAKPHLTFHIDPAILDTYTDVNVKKITPRAVSSSMNLNLELMGTLISDTPSAFIRNPDMDTCRLYKVNDKVCDAVITNIEPGRVVLRKDALFQELVLIGRGRRITSDSQRAGFWPDVSEIKISRAKMKHEIGAINEILRTIKIEPVQSNSSDELRGYRIDKVPPGSIIEKTGLKNGDIICSVAGYPVRSAKDAVQIFNKVRTFSRIDVGVVRNQRMVMLEYEITD